MQDSAACLSQLDLCSAELDRKQLVSLLAGLKADHCALESLGLGCLDLSPCPAGLLAASLPRLTRLSLSYTRLEPDQATALVRALASSRTCLTSLGRKMDGVGSWCGLLRNKVTS